MSKFKKILNIWIRRAEPAEEQSRRNRLRLGIGNYSFLISISEARKLSDSITMILDDLKEEEEAERKREELSERSEERENNQEDEIN